MDQKNRDKSQCPFYFNICIFPKFLGNGKKEEKLCIFYNYIIVFLRITKQEIVEMWKNYME